MLFRLVCLLALTPALGGCLATVSAPVSNDTSELAQLRAENKGMILIHTSLADGHCFEVLAKIVQPDTTGRYVDGKEVYLRRPPIKGPNGPSEIVLPAGDYGVVELVCSNLVTKRKREYYHARVTTDGNLITGEGTVYQQPIAKFSVLPGEFVDIGSINVSTVRAPDASGNNGEFAVTIAPIEDDWLHSLAAAKPKIYALRVQRLMTTPGRATVSASPGAPS